MKCYLGIGVPTNEVLKNKCTKVRHTSSLIKRHPSKLVINMVGNGDRDSLGGGRNLVERHWLSVGLRLVDKTVARPCSRNGKPRERPSIRAGPIC